MTPEVTLLPPVKTEVRGGVFFADFGQDAYGKLRLTLPESMDSGDFTVRLGEKLKGDGTIDRHPGGSVRYAEFHVPIQTGSGVYELPPAMPERRTPVQMPQEIGEVAPFRYAEVEGLSTPPEAKGVRQAFVHAHFREDASAFECSDATLNAVWKLCKHTMEATSAFGIYIDGDRERKPYEADAYINFLSHMACDADPGVGRATFVYLLGDPTWPTEWSFHMVMLAEAEYEATGDAGLARQNYEAIEKKLLMEKARPDGLLQAPGIIDWPASERDGYDSGDPHAAKGPMMGPEINTVVNAFYFHALMKMSKLAKAAGHADDALTFTTKAAQVGAAFNRVFYNEGRGCYVDGEGSGHASLHANMFALAFGLVPPDRQKSVADFVEGRGMACSVYGAQYLLEALYKSGRADAALKLMTSHEMRSWQHMLDLGSTMTMEAWDPSIKPNLTWNHAWGSAPANIISRYVLGVQPLEAGYGKILIAPQPGGLAWMNGTVPTARGPVEVRMQGGAGMRLEVNIPAGATAMVKVPLQNGAAGAGALLLNGKAVVPRREGDALVVDNLPAGRTVLQMGGR